MRFRLFLALSLLSTGLLTAAWKENGKAVPEKPWARSFGDFGAQLVFTDDPDSLFETWERPGPASLQHGVASAPRDADLVAAIFFFGCTPDAKGFCQTTVRFTAFGPDRKPWGDPQNADLWSSRRPPGKGLMQLGIGTMGLVLDPDDPLGAYRVKAEVIDKVAKKTIVLERTVTVIAEEEEEEDTAEP
jgi:hypothetical protein